MFRVLLKKARLVELHDVGVSIFPKGVNVSSEGWYGLAAAKSGKRYVSSGGQNSIREVWAKAEGPQLLSLHIVWEREGEDGEVECIDRGVTYSGSYTVWWGGAQ